MRRAVMKWAPGWNEVNGASASSISENSGLGAKPPNAGAGAVTRPCKSGGHTPN
jgi:hypothetical protein